MNSSLSLFHTKQEGRKGYNKLLCLSFIPVVFWLLVRQDTLDWATITCTLGSSSKCSYNLYYPRLKWTYWWILYKEIDFVWTFTMLQFNIYIAKHSKDLWILIIFVSYNTLHCFCEHFPIPQPFIQVHISSTIKENLLQRTHPFVQLLCMCWY